MHAFIDEAGVPADTEAASDHFVVSAVAVRNRNLHRVLPKVAQLRTALNRPGNTLSWKDIRSHSQRLHATQSINGTPWLKTITVVICKRTLERNGMTAEERYQWTLRLLLERLSWIARKHREQVHTVVSHIHGFEAANLAKYERTLGAMKTEIDWQWLDPAGCEVVDPASREELQLADIVASATSCAFEPDRYGNVETRYLKEMREPIWDNDGKSITTYGLKFHPARALQQQAYSWVREL